MTIEELKEDVGCAYSFIKWVILALVLIGGTVCVVSQCREEWKGILGG